MIVPKNSETAQTVPGDFVPAVSLFNSEPSRYQVFHIQHVPGSHKILISTSSPGPAGYLYYVTDVSLSDHPRTALPLMIDILNSPDQIGNIHESQCVGSIASHDLERVQAVISDHSRLLGPQSFALPPNEPTLCEGWVNAIITMLLGDGILMAPPEPAIVREHRLPRHHHTAHCIHQRLYSHHPYKRRSRQSVDRS
ncbi:uncharacterized protein B0J16DRAFT_128339 [Fusarium flagelliforme]|uniref:uncharacterized protein n=1 Tax=Fusarium flagelliforme TaxID=2675880 RepID=UPI001E8CD1C6|nr:uncharacterized protein B0J16DRAFT_128339 [Fusarium flagelliforme]KAH7185310.1 hypothetical protein B0J16DRAFT_128339 [Fusarium flagelliforme]